jgi:hypothetical protein
MVATVLRLEGIEFSALTKAICTYNDGDLGSSNSVPQCLEVAFFGDRLIAGKTYVIYGSIRLPGNNEFTRKPDVSQLHIPKT